MKSGAKVCRAVFLDQMFLQLMQYPTRRDEHAKKRMVDGSNYLSTSKTAWLMRCRGYNNWPKNQASFWARNEIGFGSKQTYRWTNSPMVLQSKSDNTWYLNSKRKLSLPILEDAGVWFFFINIFPICSVCIGLYKAEKAAILSKYWLFILEWRKYVIVYRFHKLCLEI